MNATISRMKIGTIIAALVIALGALVIATPQTAFAAQGWNSNDTGFWYEYNTKGKYYKNGWKKIGGNWYFFEKNGYAKEGWLTWKGKSYYLDGSSTITPARYNYYIKLYGEDYWGVGTTILKDGKVHTIPVMAEGYTNIGDNGYYFKVGNGDLKKKGWISKKTKSPDRWRYATSSGALATGWQKIGKKWYYFGKHDTKLFTAATGWQVVNGKSYYFDKKKRYMLTSWQKLSGKWYYFDKSNGAMQTNKWIGNYYVQTDGTMVTNAWVGNKHVGKDGKVDRTRAATTTNTTTNNTLTN